MKIPWNKGLTKETDSRVKSGWCIGLTKKDHPGLMGVSLSMLGNKRGVGHIFEPTKVTRKRMAIAQLGNTNGKGNLGNKLTAKHRDNISKALIGHKKSNVENYKWSKERKERERQKFIENYKDPVWRKKMFDYRKGMNCEEKRMALSLEEIGLAFKYVGNYEYRIGRKFPDFIDEVNRRIIEVWGDFYHRGQNPQDRIDYFKQYGWNTVVVWTSEFKDRDVLKEKLMLFGGE